MTNWGKIAAKQVKAGAEGGTVRAKVIATQQQNIKTTANKVVKVFSKGSQPRASLNVLGLTVATAGLSAKVTKPNTNISNPLQWDWWKIGAGAAIAGAGAGAAYLLYPAIAGAGAGAAAGGIGGAGATAGAGAAAGGIGGAGAGVVAGGAGLGLGGALVAGQTIETAGKVGTTALLFDYLQKNPLIVLGGIGLIGALLFMRKK